MCLFACPFFCSSFVWLFVFPSVCSLPVAFILYSISPSFISYFVFVFMFSTFPCVLSVIHVGHFSCPICCVHHSVHFSFFSSFVCSFDCLFVCLVIVLIFCSLIGLILCFCDCSNISQYHNNVHETLHLHVTYPAISKLVRRTWVNKALCLAMSLLLTLCIGKSSLALFEKTFMSCMKNCNCWTCLCLNAVVVILITLAVIFQFYTVSWESFQALHCLLK